MKSGIYEIVNTINNKRYYGSSVNVRKRLIHHKHHLVKNKHHNPHLQRAWNKYGANVFEFRVVGWCAEDYLLPIEQIYLDCDSGYNIAKIAEHSALGRKVSEKHKDIMRHKMLGNKNSLGVIRTKDYKNKIRKRMLGKKNALGCKHSEESIDRSRKGRLGIKLTTETIERMRQGKLGRKRKPFTAETRAKMSAAQRIRFAKEKEPHCPTLQEKKQLAR